MLPETHSHLKGVLPLHSPLYRTHRAVYGDTLAAAHRAQEMTEAAAVRKPDAGSSYRR